jgi:HEAT repeats
MAWPELETELYIVSLRTPELLDDPLYCRVLAHRNPIFAAIERLSSISLQERREASRELALKARDWALPHLALLRLRLLVEKEADPLIWSDLLSIIGGDDRETAADLAAIAASHPSNDIRRRACAYFGRHPSPRGTELLLNSLGDSDPSVVREALRSLGEARNLADLGPPEALLASPDSSLRLEAAVVLARFGSQAGWRALLRMTHHQDAAVRRRAAIALGTLSEQVAGTNANANDPAQPPARDGINEILRREIIGELVRLLDDHGDIRRAALTGLRQIVGELPTYSAAGDPVVATASVPNGSDEEVRRWKAWYRNTPQ